MDWSARVIAQAPLGVLLLLVNLTHLIAFGWPLDFPLPGRYLVFLPFIGNTFLAWQSLLGCLAGLALAVHPAKGVSP